MFPIFLVIINQGKKRKHQNISYEHNKNKLLMFIVVILYS